jgi:16S rRNA (adenine1518-N6/adenine1519-N6)-dimethyltransferase
VNRRRALGQHFLRSGEVLRELLEPLGNAEPHEVVAEVGAGRGSLTRLLAAGDGPLVVSAELDERLCAEAAEAVRGSRRVELVCGDAYRVIRRFDYLVSSPPYSMSSRTIEWLASKGFRLASLLLQEEFVEKMSLAPSSRRYGAISAFSQLAFRISVGRRVGPGSFSPAPRVRSRLVLLRPRVLMTEREARWALSQLRRLFSRGRGRASKVCRDLGIEGCGDGRIRDLSPREAMALAAALPARRGF